MKAYIAPQIATTGSVVESTRQFSVGTKDPLDKEHIQQMPAGSVGFQL